MLDIALQPFDQKVLIVGRFTIVNRENRKGIARLNNDKAFVPLTLPINFTTIERVNGGSSIHFALSAQPGFTYAIESSSDFTNWTTIRTITATSDVIDVTDPVNASAKFYRVRRIAP